MFDGHIAEIGLPSHHHKISSLRLDLQLLSAFQGDGEWKGFAPFGFTEIDPGYGVQWHLAVKFLLTVDQESLIAAAFDEAGKLGVFDNELLSILKADDDGSRRLKP